jgi:hypothetical protein
LAALAACADRIGVNMSKESHNEGNEEENTDSDGLVLEKSGYPIDAVLAWGTISNSLEVEEETWVANAIAVQAALEVTSEGLEILSDLFHTALVVRVLHNLSIFEVAYGLVASEEVIVSFSGGTHIKRSVNSSVGCISELIQVGGNGEISLEPRVCSSISEICKSRFIWLRVNKLAKPVVS